MKEQLEELKKKCHLRKTKCFWNCYHKKQSKEDAESSVRHRNWTQENLRKIGF